MKFAMSTWAILILGFAVVPTARAQQADTSATKAELLAADSALARMRQRDGVDGFLRALEPGAAVLFPGQPILKGAAESRAAFAARYGSPASYSWTPVHSIAATDGRFGCTMGYSRFTTANDTVRAGHRGVYLTCWRKGKDGQWRIAGTQRDDAPAEAPESAEALTLPGAPHSATTLFAGNALTAAQDADSLFAMLGAEPAGPGPAFVRYAAADAMMLGGSEFPRGPDQIAAAFKGYSPDRVITWRPRRDVGAGSGGIAFTVGHSVSGPRVGKTGPSKTGKYFTIWRQEPDGRWLYVFDLGSPRPGP